MAEFLGVNLVTTFAVYPKLINETNVATTNSVV
jgi:hypothetical protein